MKRIFIGVAAAISMAAICFLWMPVAGASGPKNAKSITFNKDVAPIFYKNCVSCHRPNDLAPMSLVTYKEVRPWARSIKEKVITREMPPWSADPHFGEFSNNVRLSQQDIDTIAAWVEAGAKEGSAKDLPPLPNFSQEWEIGKPDVVLSMDQDYTIGAQGADEYIYFRVPTGFTEDKWIQAAEFRPGNKKVVHHAVIFVETPDLLDAAKRRMQAQAQASHSQSAGARVPTIFETTGSSLFIKEGTVNRLKPGTPVVDDGCSASHGGGTLSGGSGELLAVYAPGRNADVWPAGTAKRIPAGSNLVFQMHYSKTTGKPEKDRTSVALLFAKAPVEKMIITRDVSNLFFQIPPGADNHQVTACYTFPKEVKLINYMPHMHVRGKDMKYEVLFPDGRRETLLSVPKYSFGWQTLYKLKEPITIPKGAKFFVTAHFDNSAKNKLNPDSTKAVRYGEPTYDEMMVGFFDYLTDKPKQRVIAKLDPAVLESYVGQYTIGAGAVFNVTREGDNLLVEVRGQRIQIYPESETSFFLKAIEGQVTFTKNEKGDVTELVFERGDRITRAKRVVKPATTAGQQ